MFRVEDFHWTTRANLSRKLARFQLETPASRSSDDVEPGLRQRASSLLSLLAVDADSTALRTSGRTLLLRAGSARCSPVPMLTTL